MLRVAAQGLTTPEIARALCLSEGTVRNYLSRTMTRTGARNRVDAIRIAGKKGADLTAIPSRNGDRCHYSHALRQ